MVLFVFVLVHGAIARCQTVGEVTAVIPDVSRNAQPVAVKDSLQLNDLLRTDAGGRLRAELVDSCAISLGSTSEIVVAQSLVRLNDGKLGCRDEHGANAKKYRVVTRSAEVRPKGTDFDVIYDAVKNNTTVICREGVLEVTPLANAVVIDSNNHTTGKKTTVTVIAGEMVFIGPKTKPPNSRKTKPPITSLLTNPYVIGGALAAAAIWPTACWLLH